MSSCFLSEPFDVKKYGLLFAGAQKNIGPAGTVVVIAREDLIREDALPGTPTMLKYSVHAKENSMFNTPPCYGIYICGKVFKWIRSRGGLAAMKQVNEGKGKNFLRVSRCEQVVYAHRRKARSFVDERTFRHGQRTARRAVRRGGERRGTPQSQRAQNGGRYARQYLQRDAKEGVEKLVRFMEKFEKEHGSKEMYKVKCFDKIAKCGLDKLGNGYVFTDDIAEADVALVRSSSLHEIDAGENLFAVARAGAGVNNIPVDKFAQKGIVVFNTPGANATG